MALVYNFLDSLRKLRDAVFPSTPTIDDGNARRPIVFFWSTIAIYFTLLLIMQPGWVLGGEMWAEMATNYFSHASASSYFLKFFSTDAGYIPLPQRLIAFAADFFSFPARSIPYVYTWSAIFFTGALVGSFCLSAFRGVVPSDGLRFATSLTILIVVDFETRTFINFTYFVVFFAATITALALADSSRDVPRWAWLLPPLMVSKPYALVALPAMLLVALVSKSRFRWITITAFALILVQLIQLIVSMRSGVMAAQVEDAGLGSKLLSSAQYFLGFLGGYLVGPKLYSVIHSISVSSVLFLGFLCLLLSIGIVIAGRQKENALIVVGLLIVLFNMCLNSFALSGDWNVDLDRLVGLPVYRHVIVGLFGVVLIVTGLAASLDQYACANKNDRIRKPVRRGWTGIYIFSLWFILTGWLSYGLRSTREPASPMLGNSQWQKFASAIDSNESILCVPIDPLGWMYGRNCSLLNAAAIMEQPAKFTEVTKKDAIYQILVQVPEALQDRHITSLGILIKPVNNQASRIEAGATLITRTNDELDFFGERTLAKTGGLLALTTRPNTGVTRGFTQVKVTFNMPVQVAEFGTSTNFSTAILFYGQ